MASHIWIGGAPAVAQVDTITIPSTIESGQVFTATIGTKVISYTVPSGGTASTVAAAIVSLWNLSGIPEFEEVTAADNGDGSFTLTSDTEGVPFVVTTVIGSSNEKQLITLANSPTGGTFTLTYSGQTTGNIAYNASAATVETALEALSNIGSGDATVTGSDEGPYTVEFTGALAGTDVSSITADGARLTGGSSEVQTISMINSPTGGTFRLSFNGEWTGTIAYNASAGTVQTALLALNAIPTGGVVCGGGALPGTPVTVTFSGFLANTDVALLGTDSGSLTGIGASVTVDTEGGSVLAGKTQNFWSFEEQTITEIGEETLEYTDEVGEGELEAIFAGLSIFSFVSPTTAGLLGWGVASTSGNYMRSAGYVGQFNEDEPFSLSIWTKPTSSVGSAVIDLLLKGQNSDDTDREYSLNIDASGNVVFSRKKSGGYHTVTSSGTVTQDVWNLVVAVWDPDNSRIRVSVNNSTFDDTTSLTVGTDADGGTERFRIWSGDEGYRHSGYIDSVGVYDDALTQAEVGYIYNSGTGDDYPFPTGAGTNEVQSLTLTGTPTSGEATITYSGYSVGIPVDSTAVEAEVLLQSMANIGTGNVDVTGGPWPDSDLVVEFINELGVLDVVKIEVDIEDILASVAQTTAATAGPTITVATTDVPVVQTATTANSGPNNWDVAANWNNNTAPVTSDTVYISDTDVSILYGLDQSAVTLAALHIEQTFTGFIGLPRTNTDGTSSYFEYRDSYLQIGATLLNIGDKEGDGSDRIKINLGSVQSLVLITDSGESPDGNTPPILLLGTHASNVINVNRGTVGISYYPTEVSTIATLRQAFFDDATDDTTVFLGSGVTITDIVKTGGVLDINSNTTTFKQTAGTTTIHAGAHTVLNILDGLLNYNSTGTLAAVNLSGESVLVFDQDARPKAVTVIDKYTDDSEIYDESGSIASPVIDLNNCGDLSTLHMGQNFKVTIGATT